MLYQESLNIKNAKLSYIFHRLVEYYIKEGISKHYRWLNRYILNH